MIPITNSTDAATIAQIFVKEIGKLYGMAKSIVSDRDSSKHLQLLVKMVLHLGKVCLTITEITNSAHLWVALNICVNFFT